MRFLIMHKNDPRTEAGLPPTPELMTNMFAFIDHHEKAGRALGGAGLAGSKTRTRLVFRNGAAKITHGPYEGEHELPHAILQLRVRTREEAIGWAERYGKILGDGEIELGKVCEPWDLGLMPMPENAPLQLLLIDKADPASEGAGRTAKQKGDLTRLATEMGKAGVLVEAFQLKPSKEAKRLRFTNHDLVMTDGPFAESKELIGGFSLLEISGFDEGIAICREFAKVLGGTVEIDMRLLDPEHAAPPAA